MSPLPQVDFPTISVTASLPGASPETMATSVATPLERRLGTIAGVNEMTSNSRRARPASPCSSTYRKDIDAAAREVQAAINAAASTCRRPAEQPDLPQGQPVGRAGHDPRADVDDAVAGQIYDVASTVLAQKVAQVDGVGDVNSAAARCRRCASSCCRSR